MNSESTKTVKRGCPIEARLGMVVLCGGRSSRMGVDKTELPFRGRTLLANVVDRGIQVASRVVAVGSLDFSKHELPASVLLEQDQRKGCGAMEGIRVGLKRLVDEVEFAFVTSCDVPCLRPEVIRAIFHQIGNHQAAVPFCGTHIYGTAAVYRTDLHPVIDARIEKGQLRISDLTASLDVARIPVEELRELDPELESFINVNSDCDYRELLKRS